MRYVWLILGNIWMAPNTIVSALYLGVLAAFGQVRYDGVGEWSVNLLVVEDSWLWRYMDRGGWNGFASGVFVTMREFYPRGYRHEERHVIQQLWLGPLQYPLYVMMSVFIWVFLRDLHSYYHHPLEVDARRYAGQQIDIPKSQWKDSETDRWAWWILLVTSGVLTNAVTSANVI